MEKEIAEEYNGRFINDENMEKVVREVIVVLEKWNLRQMEKEIALQQAIEFITLKKRNQIAQTRTQDMHSKMKGFIKKMGLDTDGL